MKFWLIVHSRWSVTAAVFGVALFLYGSLAVAQGLPIQSGNLGSPGYSVWFDLLVGLVIALIGVYTKGLSGRVDLNETRIEQLRKDFSQHQLFIAGDHARATRSEFEGMLNKLEQALRIEFSKMETSNNAIHRRLDNLHVPSAFPGKN